ncbi:MAG: aldo/keto reductase [Calditrichaeota bacterium]|nr:MAG: aldo/keto reductase [Calditrichota bacterium]
MHQALELGINWIDTAAAYGLGHSEEVVGKAIKGKRQEIFLATKCGLVWQDPHSRRVKNNGRPESIMNEIEDSLRRLQTDYIDLYQLHWPDPDTPVERSWEALLRLREQGKVKYIGVSNFSVDQLQKCEALGHINSLQPPYSLIKRNIEKDILPWCRENQVGVVVYSPLQAGLLTGKFDKSRLAPDDWRRKNSFFIEPRLSKNLEFVENLKPIAERYNKTVSQLAIARVLMNPGVTSAIVGARRPSQIMETIEGSGWEIDSKDMEHIDELMTDFL